MSAAMMCDCYSVDQPEQSPFSDAFRVSVIVVHVLVIAVGCVGSASVIAVFISDPNLWKPSYIFIGFLASIDVMHLLLVGVFKELKRWTDENGCWWDGVATLYLMTLSILTTIVIAVNRYVRVCYRGALYQKVFSVGTVLAMCVSLCTLAGLWSFRANVLYYSSLPSCFLDVDQSRLSLFLIMALYVAGYSVVIILYFRITRKLTVLSRKLKSSMSIIVRSDQTSDTSRTWHFPMRRPRISLLSSLPPSQLTSEVSSLSSQKQQEKEGRGRKEMTLAVPGAGSASTWSLDTTNSSPSSTGRHSTSVLSEISQSLLVPRPGSYTSRSLDEPSPGASAPQYGMSALSQSTQRMCVSFSGELENSDQAKEKPMHGRSRRSGVSMLAQDLPSSKERPAGCEQTVNRIPELLVVQEASGADGLAPERSRLLDVDRKPLPIFKKTSWSRDQDTPGASLSKKISMQWVSQSSPFSHLSDRQTHPNLISKVTFSATAAATVSRSLAKNISSNKPADNLKFGFVVCILNMTACVPFWVCFVVNEMYHLNVPVELQCVSHFLVLCVSALNSVVYGVMNSSFRESGRKLYRRLQRRCQGWRSRNRTSPQRVPAR